MKIIVNTQTLTIDFCVKYILDLDIEGGGEEAYIFDVCYILGFQKHITEKNGNTYKHSFRETNAHRDLTGFAPSFVHRAPFWSRFVKKLFCTILYYSGQGLYR